MDTWRLINTGYNDAYTNMAIDEAIFREYSFGRTSPVLRIYGWQPAAFSLGYFQDAQKVLDLAKCRQDNVLFVRRITGGSAIFHHRELTYSLVCAQEEFNLQESVLNSFKIITGFIINTYKKLGLNPEFAGTKIETSPFCFASQEKYDILIEGRKIGGNAQKRRKHIIFQHGSIPLKSDLQKAISYLKEKPKGLGKEVCSLEEALKREITFNELGDVLVDSFSRIFGFDLVKDGMSPEEEQLAESLKINKYASRQWNLNRQDVDAYQKTSVA